MSLFEQNRMLYVLRRNNTSSKNIKTIMTDLNSSNIFDDFIDDIEGEDEDWKLLEEECNILFSEKSGREKIKKIKEIRKKREEYEKNQMIQYNVEQERRVRKKREELIELGIIKSTAEDFAKEDIKSTESSIRYGRTPLHEAISMRDIHSVEKYIKRGEFLDVEDNNGHTPLEMAFYENYKDALILFNRYKKQKKAS